VAVGAVEAVAVCGAAGAAGGISVATGPLSEAIGRKMMLTMLVGLLEAIRRADTRYTLLSHLPGSKLGASHRQSMKLSGLRCVAEEEVSCGEESWSLQVDNQ